MNNEVNAILPEWLNRSILDTMADYNPGRRTDYSSTSLIKPPMILHLEKNHKEEIEPNPPSLLSSFFGTAIHNQIEVKLKNYPDDYIVEERMYAEVDGFVISCQIDLYDKNTKELSDHKTTSIFKIQKSEHDEWEQQLNINRFIMMENGYEVNSLKINGFPLDWRRGESLRDNSYPDFKFAEVHIPLWGREMVLEYIQERIALHEAAKQGFPSPCTPEDRWSQGDKWAVMRKGAKRASKVFSNPDEAHTFSNEKGTAFNVEFRPGVDLRCTEYCSAAPFCSFYNTKYGDVNGND